MNLTPLVARYWYGPDGQRYKREDIDGTKTLYIGQVEVLINGAGTSYRRNIQGVLIKTDGAVPQVNRFIFADRLGNVVKYTDGAGNAYQPQDYDSWGQRRDYDDPTITGVAAPTPTVALRGFTGHEMVDGQDVVNMNARMYDPTLGRFLQADPMIQAPENAQSWNAYTYVFNNPLTLVDPTGMFSVGKLLRQIASILVVVVANIIIPGSGMALWQAMLTGFVSGAVGSGSLQGGLIGAFSAGLFHGIGTAFAKISNGAALTAGQTAAKVLAHGIAGGVMSVLQGGKFGSGFLSAGFVELAGPMIGKINSTAGQVAAAAIIGGTASVLSGGKFANGAMTGAFSYAFNKLAHEQAQDKQVPISAEERAMLKDGDLGGFWRSRLERGDPWGRTGASIWDRSNAALSEKDLAMGDLTTRRLLSALMERDGLAPPATTVGFRGASIQYASELHNIGMGVANGHANLVDFGRGSTVGLEASARMHHRVFGGHRLAPSVYGGTPFPGAGYMPGIQSRLTNALVPYCVGCPD